jgi:hypothetical protein
MSLTSFLELKDVREKFRQGFVKPRLPKERELLAPPLSSRYSLVGTAFDYLLRFYVQRLNPKAKQSGWVAEDGLQKLEMQAEEKIVYDADADELLFPNHNGSLRTGQRVLKRGRAEYDRYMAFGKITDSLLKAVIGLAQLDVVFRSGFVDESLGLAHAEDIRDLRNLISLVKPNEFSARRICLLNPEFGIGSRLIGGADADLFIDGMLIDIKTRKNVELKREDWNQLLGYLALHELWGIGGLKRKPRISKLALYFARHAYLQVFDVKEVVNIKDFSKFLGWFRDRVEQRHNRLTA